MEVCGSESCEKKGFSGKIPGTPRCRLALRISLTGLLGSEELSFRAWYLWDRHMETSEEVVRNTVRSSG